MDWIRRWWFQPDQYQWLSDYLAARNLQSATRYLMATVVCALGVVPVLMLFTPVGPHGDLPRALAVVVTGSCVVLALLWLVTWPTRGQSAVFVVVANVAVATSCLAEASPGTGLQGCTAFAAVAGYVAFFHNGRYLAFTLAVAFGTVSSVATFATGDAALAVSKLLVLVVGVLAVSIAVQVLVHGLRLDAVTSDADPLTELPNRRAFHRSVRELAAEAMTLVTAAGSCDAGGWPAAAECGRW